MPELFEIPHNAKIIAIVWRRGLRDEYAEIEQLPTPRDMEKQVVTELIQDLIDEAHTRMGVTQALQLKRGLLLTLLSQNGLRLVVSNGGGKLEQGDWDFVRAHWPNTCPPPPAEFERQGASLVASWR